MFRKGKKAGAEQITVPGWTESPYNIIAQELLTSGLAESWDGRLKNAEPLDVVQVLEGVPAKAGDVMALGRRCWILVSAYRKMHQRYEQLQSRYLDIEQTVIEQQGKIGLLQCSNQMLSEKAQKYQIVAEKAAVKVAQNKYKKRKGRVNTRKVRAIIASADLQWDPDTWDGDVWDSSREEEEEDKGGWDPPNPVIDPPGANACPVSRRQLTKVAEGGGQAVLKEKMILQDFTQNEVMELLTKFSQRPGEGVLTWLVRLVEDGAGGIDVDRQDVAKFGTLSKDRTIMRDAQLWFAREGNAQVQTNLLTVVAYGVNSRYTDEIPTSDKPWTTLRECVQRCKEEAMKAAVLLEEAAEYLQGTVSVAARARLVKTAPPAYKPVVLTLLISMTDQRWEDVIDKMRELQDMGE
ncbi:uncharacterized protein LOC134957846 isoform X2 [Pseudophryne corroboree]|uniref:uncharacterized protein LOC134957846 isoform X2 n=1 Tax=Pseudophryne corroboree TaxID=495146 RepID=UPI003082158F